MGAPACPGVPWGLAFEPWDPSNQCPLETPILLFVIRSKRLRLPVGRSKTCLQYPQQRSGGPHLGRFLRDVGYHDPRPATLSSRAVGAALKAIQNYRCQVDQMLK